MPPKVIKQTNKGSAAPAKGVVGRIQPVSNPGTGITLSLYGRSGTGKTVLSCTFPKPLLLIGCEDGTRSVHNVKGVDFVRVRESGELIELVDHARGAYKTVVLDTASKLQDLVLSEILGKPIPAQRSWGMATREQWGTCAFRTKEYLRQLLELAEAGVSVVVVAQEREFEGETNSELIMPYVGSALSPSVTGWLNPACDYIGQTFIKSETTEEVHDQLGQKITIKVPTGKVLYCLRCGPDPVFTTKFRLPKGTTLPEYIVDPDYTKIVKLIKGG